MFNVVLVEPQIPQNTGNIAHCTATDMQLVIVGKPGFVLYYTLNGLDYYWSLSDKTRPDKVRIFNN
jgi:tRNA (cytidine/uridine-2'-O-)-methyltransferase